ncbi:VOC family protein [Propylenella binzhouense]|uniref:Glyoxalase n=1 Tax=Propylenella binzhouense TaxID=2555902 RepID=A0A964T494_9HYPH|nr:VOC family protein [Propylenella binzhouense]MYZ47657.1 glyoxalase [Propylenella binzhouense]
MRIQNFYYVAADIGQARAFYEDALGLEVKFADGERWIQFSAGGQNFALSSLAEAPPGVRGGTIVFEVEDLAGALARVEEAGGTILGERDMGGHGRTATFADPAGNVAQLFARATSG